MVKDDTLSNEKWESRYKEKENLIDFFIQYKKLGTIPLKEDMSNFQMAETGKLNALGYLNNLGSKVYKLEKEVNDEKWELLQELCDDHPNEIVDINNPPTWLLLDKRWSRCNRMIADLDHLQDLIEDTRITIRNRSYEFDRILKYHKYRSEAIFG